MVHRTRTDLLPFYARLTAALGPCMPDVPSQLAGLLKQEPMQVKLFLLGRPSSKVLFPCWPYLLRGCNDFQNMYRLRLRGLLTSKIIKCHSGGMVSL